MSQLQLQSRVAVTYSSYLAVNNYLFFLVSTNVNVSNSVCSVSLWSPVIFSDFFTFTIKALFLRLT